MNRLQSNTYVKRIAGKPVKGILQNKSYKVEYSTNRWVKLYGVTKRYSTKYFEPMNTNILKQHLDQWKPFVNESMQKSRIPDDILQLLILAEQTNSYEFLIKAINLKLIK